MHDTKRYVFKFLQTAMHQENTGYRYISEHWNALIYGNNHFLSELQTSVHKKINPPVHEMSNFTVQTTTPYQHLTSRNTKAQTELFSTERERTDTGSGSSAALCTTFPTPSNNQSQEGVQTLAMSCG